MLWVQKYCPRFLENFSFHLDINNRLIDLGTYGIKSHLLFHGPAGSGKHSRIHAMLRINYDIDDYELVKGSFKSNGKREIELVYKKSKYVIEVEPSKTGRNDKAIIQHLIKETAASNNMRNIIRGDVEFKPYIIYIKNASNLSYDAQTSLRRTMEKYSSNCKIIMSTQNLSSLIEPIRSRCFQIRIPAPSECKILSVIKEVSKVENLNKSVSFLKHISGNCQNNMRIALLMLQTAVIKNIKNPEKIPIPEWQIYLNQLAMGIYKNSINMSVIRNNFFQLLMSQIQVTVIINHITKKLLPYCNTFVKKCKLLEIAQKYDFESRSGKYNIFHLEAFAANVSAFFFSD